MTTDPTKDESLERMLEDISRTLKENQKFLTALKDDRLADDLEVDEEVVGAELDDFEEL